MAQLVSVTIIIPFFSQKKLNCFFRKPEIPVVVVAVVIITIIVIQIRLIF